MCVQETASFLNVIFIFKNPVSGNKIFYNRFCGSFVTNIKRSRAFNFLQEPITYCPIRITGTTAIQQNAVGW